MTKQGTFRDIQGQKQAHDNKYIGTLALIYMGYMSLVICHVPSN